MNIDRPLHNSPLPPAPSSRRTARQTPPLALMRRLAELEQVTGQPIPISIIPGGIPTITIAPENLVAVSYCLRDQLGFTLLSSLSGLDMMDHLEVISHLRAIKQQWLLEMRVALPPGVNEVESVIGIWQTAGWQEREAYDMFGILFNGHPDLRRILTDDEFEGYPLLKSFRMTPLVRHDRATTQVDPVQSLAGSQEEGVGQQRIATNQLSQGSQERLHPGASTFGNDQFHGRQFPPVTWLHEPDYAEKADVETYHSDTTENT